MPSTTDVDAQQQPFLPPTAQTPPPPTNIMSRFSIPIDALTSRVNLSGRFDGLRNTSVSSRFANLRPISEFLDVKRISKPANFGEVQSRVNYNLGYFSSNYAAVFAMLSIYSLLTNLLLLFVICFVIGGMFGIGKLQGNDLELGSWRASTSQLYTALFVVAIPLGLWASPFTTVLWLIGASGVTILGHAAFLDKPIEPSGATDVGRYFEGVDDDVYRFQELNSDDEKKGSLLDRRAQQLHNPDGLYFNDMDIRAWERRASALGGPPQDTGYDLLEEDEGYYDDAGEVVSRAEYEELLFSRVLDKIRVARAVGNPDVQLSPGELEAYQNRLYGTKTSAVPTESKPRSPTMDDAASMYSVNSTGQPGHTSSSKPKSKKSQPRTSLFSSKPKKEKTTERKRATSNVSSGSSQAPPGFMIPGPDGQRIYTPINAYQGSLTRDPAPASRPGSRSTSGSSQVYRAPTRDMARDVPGAFPGAYATPAPSYRSSSPPPPPRLATSWQPPQEPAKPPEQPPNLIPFPIEQYQYHSFSPTSSSSQPSPQLQYTRRPSAPPSEASYASVPRRVPVPSQHVSPVASSFDPVTLQTSYANTHALNSGESRDASPLDVVAEPVNLQSGKAGAGGKDGERRRKGGKKKRG
ncbi:PRA1 family protein-domain-containing protein [Phaeosphaeria sp. MPI-PUGE-AT-0046c]|nr:PRA1 family protein-domain-containing protein [Phaeosphaeria sp. MPI-PUGE-AT-0046c]